jgi:cation diffusion facilitator family transporter
VSASGGTKAVVAALAANLGIALTKFLAYVLTGSSSMLAEAIHSVADSGNQVLLLIGGRRSRREATARHPFGYGRERYIYAFIVSIVLFSVGGLFALYEGVHKVQHPEGIHKWQWVPITVLVIGLALESMSFRTAIREANHERFGVNWLSFIRHARAPELPVILLEDFAALIGLVFALIGVGLTLITGNGIWDGLGTLAIGVLLVAVAVLLAVETNRDNGRRPDHPYAHDVSRTGRTAGGREDRRRQGQLGRAGGHRDRRRRTGHPRCGADRPGRLP